MKIIIVQSDLDGGGIRQSLLNLLEYFVTTSFEIDILIFRDSVKQEIKQKYKNTNIKFLNPKLLLTIHSTPLELIKNNKIFGIYITAVFYKFLQKIFGKRLTFLTALKMDKKISKIYDVAISYTNDIWNNGKYSHYLGCNEYVIKKIKSVKKISWIHNEPPRLGFTRKICENQYNKFNYIVNVSEACKKMYDEISPNHISKSIYIYNFLSSRLLMNNITYENPYKNKVFNLVTVARIENKQKRIDKIIEIVKLLKKDGVHDFFWTVIGDGPDLIELKNLSLKNDLNSHLDFVGKIDSPIRYMKFADFFVQTSDYEAHSMVLLESLSVNTPVLVTNYPAASETIIHDFNGFIVEKDVKSLYTMVKSIINDKNLQNRLRSNSFTKYIGNTDSINKLSEIINQ